jgi:hypothetical protein
MKFLKKKIIGIPIIALLISLSIVLSPIIVSAHQKSLLHLNKGPFSITYDQNIQRTGTYIIWENEYPNMMDAIRCHREGVIPYCDLADDFHTEQTWTVTGMQWETVDDPAYEWDETCDCFIYEYTEEGPGDTLIEFWDITGSREFIMDIGDAIWYRYTIDLQDLGQEFDLPAGDYFILLRPVTYGVFGDSFWLTSNGNPESQSELYLRCEYFGYPNWTACHELIPDKYYDVNFRIFGTGEGIPELRINELKGGLGIKTTLENIGDGPAENIYWSITFDGGVFVYPPDGIASGIHALLEPEHTQQLKTMVLGFGGIIRPLNATVKIQADHLLTITKTAPVKVLLFAVLV